MSFERTNIMLGEIFSLLRKKSGILKFIMFALLALIVVANLWLHPHHPHVAWEKYPAFWAGFGFFGAVAMILIVKKILAKIVGRSEDYYDR